VDVILFHMNLFFKPVLYKIYSLLVYGGKCQWKIVDVLS